ncbi:MAG: CinA family nicotinamide mononucleotide deamidase-related protein [Betaproteobacteria bacterium]|nr:CinA family nicotinamide mononucleotide deamidase-related protein [Betaproteobacteria bacterium]
MRIEIICTGDEVLTGATVNTNFSHISQKLGDAGFEVRWGTTVGDDRETLLDAFQRASMRADAVIVNGGLGPTVDDLSQEIAARAAGVELVFDEDWFVRMEDYFRRRARVMPPNNRKQAMLPSGSERLDNPIGTACGFAVDIGRARFYFTPGVPRELHRMLDEQIVPRLLARAGRPTASFLKRFHSYGLGESRVDAMLADLEAMVPDGSLKLGFRAHYPQLETKLLMRGATREEIDAKLAPVEAEVRKRLGNFILAEDDGKLETVVLERLKHQTARLAILETFTGGAIAARLVPLAGAGGVIARGTVAPSPAEAMTVVGFPPPPAGHALTVSDAEAVAHAVRVEGQATHALAVLVELDEGADRIEFGGTICLAIATADRVVSRRARLLGGRDWIRLGAAEMGLDCLRRFLQGLPVDERIDFEKTG